MVPTRNIRYLLGLLVLLAILGMTAYTSFKKKTISKTAGPTPHQALPDNVDIALHNARFTEMRGSSEVWELVATDATYSKQGDTAILHGITMQFAATKKAGKCVVTSREGTYSNSTRNVTLKGNVSIETENGARFTTDTLEYDASRSLFTSKGAVEFSHDRLSLKAQGMNLDTDNQKVRFLKQTDAVITGLK